MSTSLAVHPRIVALLDGPLGWHTVRHEAQVTSTNDEALAAARAGSAPGLVVVADHQTAGRGRQGRTWLDASSPDAARSLLTSCLLDVPDGDAGLVPLAAGLAVADALRRAGASPRLKWPNDVLLPSGDGDAKCAGILVERHALPSAAPRDEVIVVGVGIDVDWRDVPRDGEAAAWTSVAESTGRDVDRAELLADLLRGVAVWVRSLPSDPLRLLVAYRDACVTIGRPVRVALPDGEVLAGTATDLDRDGRLVVRRDGGPTVAVTAGDVEHVDR